VVASGLISGPDGVLLVQNLRRDGSLDWSTPGGVVEVADGEAIVDGLTREVEEETGITVTSWEGPVYCVEAEAEGLGWRLRVEVHKAVAFQGVPVVGFDPDGIVVAARFVDPAACADHLVGTHPWVCEPLQAWLADPTVVEPLWRYRLEGSRPSDVVVTRVG